jgi:hypothetical protein
MVRLNLEDDDDGCDTTYGHDPAITAMVVKVLHESLGFEQFPDVIAGHRIEIVAALIIVAAQLQLEQSDLAATQANISELVQAAGRAWWMWARLKKEGPIEVEGQQP